MTGLSQGGTCVPSGVGLLSSPLLVELGESAYTATDAFGRRTETRKLSVINVGTGGGSGVARMSAVRPVEGGRLSQVSGRLNWRQIADYRSAKP